MLSKIQARTRGDFARDEAKSLRFELGIPEGKGIFKTKKVRIILKPDQKERLLIICDALGPTETSNLTGIAESNLS